MRILRRLATALSALLLLATLAAWGRGYAAREYLGAIRETTEGSRWVSREWGVDWGGGDVGACYGPARADAADARAAGCPEGVRWGGRYNHYPPSTVRGKYGGWAAGWARAGHRAALWDQAGIMAGRAQGLDWAGSASGANVPRADRRYYWFVVPAWMAAALFGLLPALRACALARSRRTARRTRAGQCVCCGYDLRATPRRCPECGAAASDA
jgi:hypothetical protein